MSSLPGASLSGSEDAGHKPPPLGLNRGSGARSLPLRHPAQLLSPPLGAPALPPSAARASRTGTSRHLGARHEEMGFPRPAPAARRRRCDREAAAPPGGGEGSRHEMTQGGLGGQPTAGRSVPREGLGNGSGADGCPAPLGCLVSLGSY